MMESVQKDETQKPKTLSCSPEVHRDFKMFVVQQGSGSMQDWADKMLIDGMEREKQQAAA